MTEKIDNINYPIQLENGMARLFLPPKITRRDAERIAKVVAALVIEDKPHDS
jgi:hypothetical protein